MDRSNRSRDRGGQNSRGRGGHGSFNSGNRGIYSTRGALSRGGRGGYTVGSHIPNRDSYTSVNQGFTGTNVTNMSNNNNGTVPGRERASRWGDNNNSQVTTQLQPSQHQPVFVSQPPVQIPNMSNPPPGYNYGFQAQQPNNSFRGGF